MDKRLLKRLVFDQRDKIIAWRRQIHKHPELGLSCFRTAALVSDTLRQLGLDVAADLAHTGVAAFLRGKSEEPVVALRVDMDALPIQEKTGLSFASGVEGCMHACGHDGHTAIGLGAATVLTELQAQLPGSVKFIFQPAEESDGGAKRMIADGVLEGTVPDAIVGLHIYPYIDAGTIGICFGATMAGTAEFELQLRGKGGHAALPQECNDPITACGHLIVTLQNLLNRRTDPTEPVVLSFGTISGGSGYNVIPDTVTLKGTCRFLHHDTKQAVYWCIEKAAVGIEKSFGVSVHLDVVLETPPLVTHESLSEFLFERCHNHFDDLTIVRLSEPSMLGEDFSEFTDRIPGIYLRVGSFDEKKGFVHELHQARFDFDEKILLSAVEFVVFALINLLEKKSGRRSLF
jgi:amidohydrolase